MTPSEIEAAMRAVRWKRIVNPSAPDPSNWVTHEPDYPAMAALVTGMLERERTCQVCTVTTMECPACSGHEDALGQEIDRLRAQLDSSPSALHALLSDARAERDRLRAEKNWTTERADVLAYLERLAENHPHAAHLYRHAAHQITSGNHDGCAALAPASEPGESMTPTKESTP